MKTSNKIVHGDADLNRRQALKGAAAALAAAAGMAAAKPVRAGVGDEQNAMVGAWLETVNGSGGHVLYTYGMGGIVNAATDTDQTGVRRYSPTFGAWQHLGPNRFNNHLVSFQMDPDGAIEGIFRSMSTLRLATDGNSYRAQGSWQIDSVEGTAVILGPFFFSSSAERITP